MNAADPGAGAGGAVREISDYESYNPSAPPVQALASEYVAAARRLDALRTARRQCHVEHLFNLGVVATYHALIEVAAGRDLDGALLRYRLIDTAILRAFGGDRFPSPPIYLVRP